MLTSQDAASSSTAAAAAAAAADAAAAPISPPPAGAGSYNPSLLIIAAILIFVIAASASIHLLLRLLSRPSRSPTFILNPNSTSTSTSTSSSSSPSDHDPTALIASLPLSTAAAARFSGDCAVCLSRLRPHNRLRILPACSHAFHPACIDAWLRSSPSCPLCRSQITTTGLVIRTPDTTHPVPPPIPRTFSIGSEEDIESVVARVTTGLEDAAKEENHEAPAPPGEAVAMEAGGGRGGWLKDYVDRLASSASSSFSSMRRGSLRSGGGGRESWDLEDGSGHTASLYRWLSGLSS